MASQTQLDFNIPIVMDEKPLLSLGAFYGLHSHKEILVKLLEKVKQINFREIVELEDADKLRPVHYRIKAIEEILSLAKSNNWGICQNHNFIYLYNGAYWSLLEENELRTFLGEAAEKMGVHWEKARDVFFRKQLFEQFNETANLSKPEQPKDIILINLKNGTFEITPKGYQLLDFKRENFLTYQLPFEYESEAAAPMFESYLNKVLPDKQRQNVLSEYLAYVFIKTTTLKLEKTLLLYGTGANGKSVFFDIVNALFGADNVSSYSLQSLTDSNGYYRAMLSNKLVNYASEINGKLETSLFKQMVSGEPVEARLPYGLPYTMSDYAKLIFNCNDLPKEIEHSAAYFRRFLIIPFDVTIPDKEQDKQLSQKIIAAELSGIFNWVLSGLNRLLAQKNFSECEAAQMQVEKYKLESDTVQMFLQEEGHMQSNTACKSLKELYSEYKSYCDENGYYKCSIKELSRRLRNSGFKIERRTSGNVVFIQK